MMTASVGSYLEVAPGVEIYYEEHGTGSPLVFVPGWTFTTEVFEHQVAHFARSHRVIVVDPRSQGRSSKTLQGNDYSTHGADLAKLFASLELRDAVLVGWSTGTLDVLGYVQHAGTSALKGVVGIDMSPKPLSVSSDDWVEGPLDELAGAWRAFLRSPQGQRDFIIYYANEVMVQRALSPAEQDWIVRQSLTTPHYLASAIFADAMFCDFSAELQTLAQAVPTLYVLAEHWAETATAFLTRNFPLVKTESFGGHMMFWEHAERFNATLTNFIEELG
ncbi:alpha/beta fold hydrolase [Candidatus Chloroploca asiatica]|nr:alpha/beta hydrolase [Candidatus Chloroploca asiatica]